MKKIVYFTSDFYDRHVIKLIIDKYNLNEMEATRRFILSEPHDLLEDAENGMMCYPAHAIFDMWEAKQATGDHRNSINIKGF